MKYDLIVRGGLVVDGTGSEPFKADIGIVGDRIAAVGTVSGEAHEEIDASGAIVTPGFVDIHTHYDGQAIWSNRLNPSSSHGVTTVVMGNCGVGFAPCRPADHQTLIDVMEGVEDIPGIVMAEGLNWSWETFPEYLDALEARPRDIDVAAFLGHAPLRVYVMGQRGVDREPAGPEDLAEMRRLTCEAVEAGALGVATSRIFVHKMKDGRDIPCTNAPQEELREIAKGLTDADAGIFQMVLDVPRLPWRDEIGCVIDIARHSGRPAALGLGTPNEGPPIWKEALSMIEEDHADGVTVLGEILPRPVGVVAGFELSFHPFCQLESYKPLAALPFAERVRELRKPEVRARLIAEDATEPVSLAAIGRYFDWMFPFGDPPNYEPPRETSISAQAKAKGVSPAEVAYDLMMENDGQGKLLITVGNYYEGSLDALHDLMNHPHTVMGLGDGGAHYGAICDASYPTFFLTYWSRDRKGDRIPLPKAVRDLARTPAEAVGLLDRGLLKPGFKADLNVIDFDRLTLHAPAVKYDLPAGGRRLDQTADGYVATIVSGKVIARGDRPTGMLPGRVVRGAQTPPPQPPN
ncbi:MAG TPA: amidohydrolase family protein [Alphaproteobacteria bacterium]|nr:amidohydrolase family protein [Alphaproteobacteria bacterium]